MRVIRQASRSNSDEKEKISKALASKEEDLLMRKEVFKLKEEDAPLQEKLLSEEHAVRFWLRFWPEVLCTKHHCDGVSRQFNINTVL